MTRMMYLPITTSIWWNIWKHLTIYRFHNNIPHLPQRVWYDSPLRMDSSRKERPSLPQRSICHGLVRRDQAWNEIILPLNPPRSQYHHRNGSNDFACTWCDLISSLRILFWMKDEHVNIFKESTSNNDIPYLPRRVQYDSPIRMDRSRKEWPHLLQWFPCRGLARIYLS